MNHNSLLVCVSLLIVSISRSNGQGNGLDQLRTLISGLPGIPGLPALGQLALTCVGQKNIITGTCQVDASCTASGGYADGPCLANPGQVCCLKPAKCGETILTNNSVIANPAYPNGNQDSSLCQYTVQLPHPHIKHILLDFVSFELAPPTRRGECFQDKFVVEGVAEGTRVLPLCGHNTKQHLVLPINRKAHNSVLIKLITSGLFDRKYHIKISMLEDGNPMLPPDGCTQYIAGALEGTVSSLNYKDSSSRTIDGMRYSTCFRKETGFCGVEFSKVYFDLGSMRGMETASGDGATGEAEEVDVNSGNTTEVVEGSNSTAPSSTEVPVGDGTEEPMATNGTNAQVNRCQGSDRIGFPPSANSTKCPCSLCGTDFNDGRPLTVNVQPLIMFYESGRRHGKGFSLKYRYVIC